MNSLCINLDGGQFLQESKETSGDDMSIPDLCRFAFGITEDLNFSSGGYYMCCCSHRGVWWRGFVAVPWAEWTGCAGPGAHHRAGRCLLAGFSRSQSMWQEKQTAQNCFLRFGGVQMHLNEAHRLTDKPTGPSQYGYIYNPQKNTAIMCVCYFTGLVGYHLKHIYQTGWENKHNVKRRLLFSNTFTSFYLRRIEFCMIFC